MLYYKLTDRTGCSGGGIRRRLEWGPGVTHAALGREPLLRSAGVIHAYTDPHVAVFLNPVHAGFKNPQLWEAVGEVVAADGLQVGVRALTTLRKIPCPRISCEERLVLAIRCALEIPEKDPTFVDWAHKWLEGTDRTEETARAVERKLQGLQVGAERARLVQMAAVSATHCPAGWRHNFRHWQRVQAAYAAACAHDFFGVAMSAASATPGGTVHSGRGARAA